MAPLGFESADEVAVCADGEERKLAIANLTCRFSEHPPPTLFKVQLSGGLTWGTMV